VFTARFNPSDLFDSLKGNPGENNAKQHLTYVTTSWCRILQNFLIMSASITASSNVYNNTKIRFKEKECESMKLD